MASGLLSAVPPTGASGGDRGLQGHHLHLLLELAEVQLSSQLGKVSCWRFWQGRGGDVVLFEELEGLAASVLVAIAQVLQDSAGHGFVDFLEHVSQLVGCHGYMGVELSHSMIDDVQFTDERWLQFWKNYQGLEHQIKAIVLLGRQIKKADTGLLTETAAWAEQYRDASAGKPRNPLPVKYQSQLDNSSGTGYRECFSSSCAMLAMYWGKVANDDAYNLVRVKYGDSTSSEAQLAALRSLGLKADFHTNGTPEALEREIDAGRPVAVGWLHKGTVMAPTGGGHWSVVIGYTPAAWIQNDPNGEAYLVGGGYSNHSKGAGVAYSRKNWDRRWMVNGSGGWYLTCRP